MTTTATETAAPSLRVCLGDDPRPDLPEDAHQLAAAFLAHALAAPPGPLTIPAGRLLRRQHLATWSRNRYGAAMRALIDAGLYQAAQTAAEAWHVLVTVPSARPGPLRASAPGELVIRLWLDRDDWPNERQMRADLEDVRQLPPGMKVTLDLGETTRVHPGIVRAVNDAVAAGYLPEPTLRSTNAQVLAAWFRALKADR